MVFNQQSKKNTLIIAGIFTMIVISLQTANTIQAQFHFARVFNLKKYTFHWNFYSLSKNKRNNSYFKDFTKTISVKNNSSSITKKSTYDEIFTASISKNATSIVVTSNYDMHTNADVLTDFLYELRFYGHPGESLFTKGTYSLPKEPETIHNRLTFNDINSASWRIDYPPCNNFIKVSLDLSQNTTTLFSYKITLERNDPEIQRYSIQGNVTNNSNNPQVRDDGLFLETNVSNNRILLSLHVDTPQTICNLLTNSN